MSGSQFTPINVPEFDPGIGGRGLGNAVSLYQGCIFAVGAGHDNHVSQALFAIETNGLSETSIKDQKLWTNAAIAFPYGTGTWQGTAEGQCGSAVSPGSGAVNANPGLYVFWSQDNGGPMAAPCTAVIQPGVGTPNPSVTWGVPLLLLDVQGQQIPMRPGAAVSAAAAGADTILLAFPTEQAGQPAVYIGLFSTTAQAPGNTIATKAGTFGTWPAQGEAILTLDLLGSYTCVGNNGAPTFVDTGASVSIALFASAAPPSGASPGAAAMSYVMAFMTPKMSTTESGGHQFWWPVQVMLSVDQNGVPLTQPDPLPTIFFNDALPSSPITGTTDPAGRVVGWALQGHSLVSLVYPTFGLPAVAQSFQSPLSAPSGSGTPCSVIFYLDAAHSTQNNYNNANGIAVTTTSYPVYALAFYGGTTKVQVNFYGTVAVTPGYATATLKMTDPVTQQTVTPFSATGIIDAPVPIPAENVNGWQMESSENTLASISYGVTDSSSSGATTSWSWNVGLQAETQVVLGASFFGLASSRTALDFGFSYQYQGALSRSTVNTATLTSQWALKADVNVVKVQTTQNGQPVTNQVGDGMVPNAGVWGASPSLSFTNFQFQDPSGTVIADGSNATDPALIQGLSANAVTLQLGSAVPVNFIPYMVQTGTLLSYTPDGVDEAGNQVGINATMLKLAAAAGTPNQLPGGTRFTQYFEEIIYPSAYSFTVGNRSQNYLLFTWSTGPMSGQTFTAMTESANTYSMQQSVSAFAGISFSVGAVVPDFGSAKWTGSVQLNGGFQYNSSTSSTSTSGWGITISPPTDAAPPWGPPNWGSSPDYVSNLPNPPLVDDVEQAWSAAVNSYTFALFFLPDPGPKQPNPAGLPAGYWVKELAAFGNTNQNALPDQSFPIPTNLDPTAGCWRIVFVVIAIKWNNGQEYNYSDPNNWFPHPSGATRENL